MSDDDKTRISPSLAYTGVGTQLSGIYELDERIASGGMGEVYRGHNIQTGDHVAIKIVLPEFARDQTILSLFRKEASILNHLSHDAVVRYHVFTIDPGIGRPYLAMEFVDGQSLFDVMRRGPMSPPDVRRLCHRLTSGLSAVHQAGAVHRDLSPDNIILPGGRVERAKIIDFGIARSANVGGETLIGGKFAGKYNYVSPEQLGLYGGEVSEQSDIYSLGLVLAAALRGKPLDMSGSQYEVIEKRRTVPDLSDIDPDFRSLIEAMLQPDPQDRPASMAEIARATRDDDYDATLPPPASFAPRERSGLPRAAWTAPPDAGSPPSTVPGEPRFVPHVRPAHLSEPRPSSAAAAPRAAAPAPSARPKRSRFPAIAGGVVALAVGAGAGLYFAGVMSPRPPAVEKPMPLAPKPAQEPVTETPKPQPETSRPLPSNNAAGNEPAKPVSPAPSQAEARTGPEGKPADAGAEQNPAQPAETPAPKPRPPAEIQRTPAAQPESDAKNRAETPQPTEPAKPSTGTPTPAPKVAQSQKPAQPTNEPPPAKASGPSQTEAENSPAPEAKPPATRPSASDLVEALSKLPKPKTAPPAESQAPASPPSQPTAPEAAGQPATPSASTQPAPLPQTPPAAKQPQNTDVVINLPKPQVPPPAKELDELTQRASWVRDFSGGDCFYASLTSATDGAAAIEGFGTTVQPFEQLLNDFQSRFHLEPDISVRLIDQPQCEVTSFLRFLDRSGTERPQLVLDRTSVPDGAPISGTIVTRGGLISNVMLIDHKGIAFNLDERMVAQPGKAAFSIPIGLSDADRAAGKALPQIMLVITGPRDIQAAMFSRPTPASELLPRILEEIEADGSQFSATAKYFRLGG
ncbi:MULTISPECIES: serine/threonine-protein kinase [unclassified Mesorhizobium]|uniref:serine/threonine-protein kinase n=1 Tax=unclassified Mesorhizobium TaxID=325217 RepID=UPI000FCB9F05|nr:MULTISPECIES: serine/threonine-protein kinase [unclassified Mesorhizobium]TGP20071.1 serine/threonine protein kinase [Mesorhizobium sp. M1D.F.Ca.ET.231.01.1.1]TGP27443.1 serine/threonine protein kinase [Mesorhizobium sp. M1D.F.Ca.ET.234.01.1.1]TGS41478.1 serine/threonine protein kinase [Mesorhizobium sp. M1D.F.Ca.ET.184.01.1.1]TGS59239.1 serine/threonine protein kinase [Mesorhizobium sp. M1D.F.Ca.ET.183.01.1.1]